MKHLIQQIILLIFYLVFIDLAQASTDFEQVIPLELATSSCYHHSLHPDYSLLVEENDIYLQETVKDYNKISYVSQSKVRLKDITDKGARIISDDGNKILVLSNAKYYFIPKPLSKAKKNKITLLFNENEVSKIVSNKFFLVSGHWYYVSYTSKGESNKHKLPELKGNLEIIADSDSIKEFYDNVIILKDDNSVYTYDRSIDKLEKIPHLTPSQTHFFSGSNHFLYDDDTFYLIDRYSRYFEYRDITKDFNLQGKYDGFTKAEMYSHWIDSAEDYESNILLDTMDTKDGLIWFYSNGIYNSFKSIQAAYLNTYKDLYVYNDKVYDTWDFYWDIQDEANPSDPSYRDSSIDISNVQNPSKLHKIVSDVFFDSQQFYSFEENSRRLEKKDPPTYLQLLTTKDYIEIREKQIFVDWHQLNTEKFQDTPIFLGSIVDIVNPCSRYINLRVNYYYFFTDGKKVYAYINPEKNQKPKVLDNISPQNLKVNDYDTLKKLLNMFKTTAKEND